MLSINTTMGQTEMSQWPKCLSKKNDWNVYAEKNHTWSKGRI